MYHKTPYQLAHSLLVLLLSFGICSTEIFANTRGNTEIDIGFNSYIIDPISGQKPDSIVVLLHGYGDTGENFILLGPLLGEFLPSTLFVAIDGPIACKTIPQGKQWLRTSQNNKSELFKEIRALTISLNKYLDNLLNEYNLPSKKLAFLGFSQGARVALHAGLRRTCAGIVAISGSYLDDPTTATNLPTHHILIIHGINDTKAPVNLARESYNKLAALNIPVTLEILQGVEHDIDVQGLVMAAEFLTNSLGYQIAAKDKKTDDKE